MAKKLKVLLAMRVSDEAEGFMWDLRKLGHWLAASDLAEEGLVIASDDINLVIAEPSLRSEHGGIWLLEELRKAGFQTPFALLVRPSEDRKEDEAEVKRLGGFYLRKPISMEMVVSTLPIDRSE